MSFSCRSSNCRKARRPLRRCCQVRRTARPRARSAWIRCQTRLDGRVRTVRGDVAVFIITTFFWHASCPRLPPGARGDQRQGHQHRRLAPPTSHACRATLMRCLSGQRVGVRATVVGCRPGYPAAPGSGLEPSGASRMRPPALPCRPSHGKETVLHYPARHDRTRRAQPADDPVVLWLQGGGTSLLILSHTFYKFGRHAYDPCVVASAGLDVRRTLLALAVCCTIACIVLHGDETMCAKGNL
jgi:hypothetical protein